MIIHPRERLVREAENKLTQAFIEWAKDKDLTIIEELQVVNKVSSDWVSTILKYELRQERHGNKNTPSGLAG